MANGGTDSAIGAILKRLRGRSAGLGPETREASDAIPHAAVNATPPGALKICATNFWADFSMDRGLVKYLVDVAFGDWTLCESQADADLVLTSVFPHRAAERPHKTLAIIWENVRPNYSFYAYSLSSDPDHYGGRNFRLPHWYREVAWSPDYLPWDLSGEGSHGHEPLLPLPFLMQPRSEPFPTRRKFCAFVARNPEPYRMMTAEAMRAIAPVDAYGLIAGSVESRSKYEILRDYAFSMCFENSLFPGYHTEKLVQAWAAGTIPLYFGDRSVELDFNRGAFLNRHDFPSLDAFVEEVRRVYASAELQERIWREPLITHEPSLAPAAAFLRETLHRIRSP